MSKEDEKKRNFEEKMKFIDLWANYVKTHQDRDWSAQQKVLLDSQVQGAKKYPMTKEQYLEIKGKSKK